MTQQPKMPTSANEIKGISARARRITALMLSVASLVLIFALMLTPFFKTARIDSDYTEYGSVIGFDIFDTEDSAGNELYKSSQVAALSVFISVFLFGIVSACMLFSLARKYSADDEAYYGAAQSLILYADFITGGYCLSGIVFSGLMNILSKKTHYKPGICIPFLLCIVVTVVFAFLTRKITVSKSMPKPDATARGTRIEFYIYASLISILAICCVLGNILEVEELGISFNGLKALIGGVAITAEFQLLAFLVLAFLTVNITFMIMSTISLAGRSRVFYQISIFQVITGTLTTFIVGLFGKYFEIAQDINIEAIRTWVIAQLEKYDIEDSFDVSSVDIDLEIKSGAFWFFLIALGVLCLLLIRKPYSRGSKGEMLVAIAEGGTGSDDPYLDGGSDGNKSESGEGDKSGGSSDSSKDDPEKKDDQAQTASSAPAPDPDHDPCPAISDIDKKHQSFRSELAALREKTFEEPTLPALVEFVVNYARDSRLHLSYTPEDIATFVAGLGTTRLTILQGMSGTGKTSLPKIFTEALLGRCDIVEIESAWRDKNELLGYYNEFSKVYTPKKFTLALYRARLFPERPTFIVLDEMNLSRIEYYFSDFLSLMEHEADRREIKLLGTPLYRRIDGKRYHYVGLTDGTTIKIPGNIWFVGTANRDESTFEISDKVYDRAHTMNFNKRAPKVRAAGEPIPQRFISTAELLRLFEDAKASVHFDIDQAPVIAAVEALLAPYNISFGNRIANQIESFVRIYAACFGGTDKAVADGLERILLSKVVAKLEYKSVDNKEEMAEEFEKLGLFRCRDFVMGLNED